MGLFQHALRWLLWTPRTWVHPRPKVLGCRVCLGCMVILDDCESLLVPFLETLEVLVSSLWKTPDMSLAQLWGFTLSFPWVSVFLFRAPWLGGRASPLRRARISSPEPMLSDWLFLGLSWLRWNEGFVPFFEFQRAGADSHDQTLRIGPWRRWHRLASQNVLVRDPGSSSDLGQLGVFLAYPWLLQPSVVIRRGLMSHGCYEFKALWHHRCWLHWCSCPFTMILVSYGFS